MMMMIGKTVREIDQEIGAAERTRPRTAVDAAVDAAWDDYQAVATRLYRAYLAGRISEDLWRQRADMARRDYQDRRRAITGERD